MSRWLRTLILLLLGFALVAPALAACDSSDDDATAAPAAFVSPVDHKTYCPWVESPHETDFGCGNPRVQYPPAPFPIPTDTPVREPGMSDADFFLLGALFGHGMGYHGYYFGPSYYDMFIGPAYNRYPGYVAYGWGHRPISRVDARTYNTTVINHVNTKYSAQERAAEKTVTYKTANGKTFTGDKAPGKAFSGTNVIPKGPAGDAPVGTNSGTKPTKPSTSTGTSTGGKGKSYSGSSHSSSSKSSSSSSHSGRR